MARAGEVGWLCERDLRCAAPQGDIAHLAENVAEVWARHFPRRSGYVVLSHPLADGSGGVRMSAIRGDFRADLDVGHRSRAAWEPESILPDSRPSAIALHASAGSIRISPLASFGEQLAQTARVAVASSPFMLALGTAWMLFGTQNPVFWGCGLAFLVTLATVGGLIGEQIARRGRARALEDMASDAASSQDLQRWRAACRQLSRARNPRHKALGWQPFRSEAPVPREITRSRRALPQRCSRRRNRNS